MPSFMNIVVNDTEKVIMKYFRWSNNDLTNSLVFYSFLTIFKKNMEKEKV